jgi:uncharacterized protein (TIGR00251 family)
MSTYFRRDGERLILEVHVQPGASRTGVAGLHGGRLKIRVAAPPAEGRANEALIAFLAQWCKVPKRNISVAAGAASRMKRIVIEGAGSWTPPPTISPS